MQKARALIFPFFLSLLFFSATAWAQEKNEEQDFGVYDLGEVVVAGEKSTVSNTAITNEVTAEQIEATNSRTVAEALSHVPGLRVSTGRKNEPGVSIHGFDQTRILVLIDGVPYYETKYHKLDLNQLPTDNIAKIVVTKGAASVLYGANAMGGVINIITKKATTKPSVSATVEGGDRGYNREVFSTGWKKGIFSYWLNYTRLESPAWRLSDDFEPIYGTITRSGRPATVHTGLMENGGYRNNSYINSDAVWAKFGIEPNPDSEYFANFFYINREKGVPPNIREERIPSPITPVFSQMCRILRYDDWGIDLSGKQKIFDQLTLRGKLFYHNHMDEYDSYFDREIEPGIWTPDYDAEKAARSRYKDYFLGGALYADYQPVSWDILRFSYHYQGDSHKQRDDTYLPFEESYSYTGSIGLENQFDLIKNLSVVAGVSRDWYEIEEAHKNITGTGGVFLRQDHYPTGVTKREWNPMGGLTYQLFKDTRIFTSVARKSRFPTLSELFSSQGGNPSLKAEHSVNTTSGIDHSFGKFAWGEVSYFYHHIKNWIYRSGPSATDINQNIGFVKMYGFELNTEFYPPIKNLVFTFDYMYDHARDHSDNRATDRIPYTPLHKFDAGLQYTVPWTGTLLNFDAIYIAQIYNQVPTMSRPTDQLRSSDSQMTFDCRISQKFLKYFEAYLAMNNMLDRDYEPEYGYPAPGRSFWFGLTAKY